MADELTAFDELKEALYFKDSEEWRRWLEQNHDKDNGVWLLHYKKNSGRPGLKYNEALEQALCFGWIDGKMKSIDNKKFILRYSLRKPGSIWSKINRDKAERLIAAGMMTRAGLARIEEARQNGLWADAYTNKIRDEIPADLEDALRKNKTAWDNFNSFANTYRNMYIGWVIGAKTKATRDRRIKEVVKRSELNVKPGT